MAKVIAVDQHPGQLQLTRLKAAAVEGLERLLAIRFLGFLPAEPAERHQAYARIRGLLDRASQTFWDDQHRLIGKGVIHGGRFERYLARLQRVSRLLLGNERFDTLFEAHSREEQERHFEQHFNTRAIRLVFRIAFHERIYARRGMDPRGLSQRTAQGTLAEHFLGRLRSFLVGTPVRENYLLQYTFLRRCLSADSVPLYLSSEGFPRVREALPRLELRQADVGRALESLEEGSFDKVHLSNVVDWMPQSEFERVLGLVADRCHKPGRLVWRYIHARREVPRHLAKTLVVDGALGEELTRLDRYPFYSIVPARVVA